MLIVAGTITFDPSHLERAKAAATAMMAATREEPGNIDYVFSIDMSDESVIRVYEAWETEDALAAHFDMPHMAAFGAAVAEIGVSGMDIQKHQVSSSGPLR